jgi:hypothetical protein
MTQLDDRSLRDEVAHLDATDLRTALQLLYLARTAQGERLTQTREDILRVLVMTGEPVVPEASLTQANRLAAHRNRLLQTAWFSYEILADLRGDSSESATRTWVTRQRDKHALFTVSHAGRAVIPGFQFTDTWATRDDLGPALAVLMEGGVDGWELWTWLTTPTGWLGGRVPQTTARERPELVEAAARNFLAA